MTDPLPLTPSQTVGPFLAIALDWPDGPDIVPADAVGALRITGRLFDGNGDVVPDGLVETWQADAQGRFSHPDDPRGAAASVPPGFRGYGRCATAATGGWHIVTVKPLGLPTDDGRSEAPHINVSVFARGLLDRVVTRIYFPDEPEANAADPVLAGVPPQRRSTLIAAPDGDGLHFDIHLQGPHETVFFDL